MPESIETNLAKPMTGLFKYFPPAKLEFFENSLVLLTPPKYLNDPWDFLPQGRAATCQQSFKEWQKCEKDISEGSQPVSAEIAKLRPEDRLQRFLIAGESQEYIEGLPGYSRDYVSSIYGIVSFAEAEKPTCRLMWAHYAASHSGFVAEFSATKHFESPEEKLTCRYCIGLKTYKVEYPLDFKPQPWTSDTIWVASMSKHPLWKYEQEWRILFPLDDKLVRREPVTGEKSGSERYCLPFLPEHLTRVIFGMQMKPEDQQRLRIMLNKPEFKDVQKQIADIDNETGELILKPLS